MKRIFEHIMTYLAAAAYAEVGDFDAVRALLQEEKRPTKRDYKQDRLLARPTAPRSA